MSEQHATGHGDMSPEEFRRSGHQVIDWIADYLGGMERYPVLSRCRPGDIRGQIPNAPPTGAESMDRILEDVDRVILPGITHWNHPSFHSYFSISGSGPGILGELISAALNVNGMLWRTSPAATELEEAVLDWLRQMLKLPEQFWGIIYDTASISTFHALAAARQAVETWDSRKQGLCGMPKRLRAYASEQAHSSVEKAALALGIGLDGVRKIGVDDDFRMRPDLLEVAVEEDLKNGWLPFCVTATVGTTSTTSVDPVDQIAPICRRFGLWLHVDGAYGGPAAVVPELNWILRGCEDADSIVVNPHKWLFTPIDCSVFYCRRPEVLREAFSLVPEYLKSNDAATNFMDYGIQLGRRFRALKLWMVIRYFGVDGIAARIREHVAWAKELARWIDDDPDFERLAPVPFSTVCFRAVPRSLGDPAAEAVDRFNESLIEAINREGEIFVSHTRLRGKFTIRLAIGNIKTTRADIVKAWDIIRRESARLLEDQQ